jgi:coenzyme PQQ synthesis protein D (PqqD)
MEPEARQFVPRRRDLPVREIADEVVLYELKTWRAHCLNPSAAAVWRLCDGHRNVAEIARSLGWEEDLVWTALQELNESNLLENEVPSMTGTYMLSRRELVKKISIGASIALPVVTSILVPTPSAAASPPKHPRLARPRSNG